MFTCPTADPHTTLPGTVANHNRRGLSKMDPQELGRLRDFSDTLTHVLAQL
jgi:hypothetical protein